MSKFSWSNFIGGFESQFPDHDTDLPWALTARIREVVRQRMKTLGRTYKIADEVAIHKSAVIESNVILKGPMIIGPDCFIATGCYLRDGVWLVGTNSLGPGCEVKSSVLFSRSNLAHFNFVGDSVVGSDVNFEAGSIIANHYNERKDKNINAVLDNEVINTQSEKFGALVGDGSRIGANAVLSPGTILPPNSIVARLQLIDQLSL
jgi:UDP-N-acetylglucosamine diphosphorylase / glucose-1-phosphate thymidylyltransferase / UDP-N-acetylgalactosamine diphosphorylase / glucosamine-1-phosphate N-acetyltransferase / galactosamine-1-phosphate N-acetyltransferase